MLQVYDITMFCNHHSGELTTSQIIHISGKIELNINVINSTKCNVESNHCSKYPGQNTDITTYCSFKW